MNKNYHLGLLHLVHILINVDGRIDDREISMLQSIKDEEKIDDSTFKSFGISLGTLEKQDIYKRGIALLNSCSEEEKLCAFTHLFRLAESDATIDRNEIRILMTAIKQAKIDFEDVELITRLSSPGSNSI
jgi:uncharacterized tellurite resistance protein B-like protein